MSAERPTVGLVGAGAMGTAVLAGLLRAGWATADLRVVERDPERAAALTQRHGLEPVDLAVAAGAAVVVLAVKPPQVGPLLDDLAGSLGRDGVVLSLAAGVPTRAMQARLPHGTPVVRVGPNTPALVGQGVSALSGGVHAREEHLALAEQVMAAVGTTLRVPEALQDAVTALSGSGPAYVFYVIDAMTEGGVLLGLDRTTARELAVRTVLGSAHLAAETGGHPAQLREQVTSPAGTTVAALRVLDRRGVRAAVLDAMEAARDRSLELGAAAAAPTDQGRQTR